MASDKYGVLYFSQNPTTNVGDFVQSIAARQFLPSVDQYCHREKLDKYDGENIKMIMNAWYMFDPTCWPPSDKINPLYVSVHINSSVYDEMTNDQSIAHFKKHQPIGCRDIATRDLLISKGVDAYFSGCLTLTLGETYKRNAVTDSIYIIDPLFHYHTWGEMLKNPKLLIKRILDGRIKEFNWRSKILNLVFSKDVLEKAESITQIIPTVDIEGNFKIADEYLKKLCNAKLVITSRIHCALPCLAMGTPVIFSNGGFGGNNNRYDSRFKGIIDLFNKVDIDKNGNISYNFSIQDKIGLKSIVENKNVHLEMKQALIAKCKAFLK